MNPNFLSNLTPFNFIYNQPTLSLPVGFSLPLNIVNLSFSMTTPVSVTLQNSFNPLQQPHLYNPLAMQRPLNNFETKPQKLQSPVKIEPPSSNSQFFVKNSPSEEPKSTENLSKSEDLSPNESLPRLCDPNKSVRAHVKDIIYYVLDSFGKLDKEEFNKERLKYRNNQDLMTIFDALASKYFSTGKTKEEIMKYTFKKALKFMKEANKQSKKKGNQAIDSSTQRKIFETFFEQISSQIKDDHTEQKNQRSTVSRSKQASKKLALSPELIAEAFASEDFCDGFNKYLEKLDQTLELDNNKRIEKFVRFVEAAIKKGNVAKDIKKYKKIPWLKIWIENTKKASYEIIQACQNTKLSSERKIVKKEEPVSGSGKYPDITLNLKAEETSF